MSDQVQATGQEAETQLQELASDELEHVIGGTQSAVVTVRVLDRLPPG